MNTHFAADAVPSLASGQPRAFRRRTVAAAGAASAAVLALPLGALAAPEAQQAVNEIPAASLRTALNLLGQEHVYLAGASVAAALGGRQAEFEAAATQVDENSKALAGAVGSVYGQQAGDRFLAIWRSHIGFFVDYTQGAAANDQAKKQKARNDLDGYRRDIDAFLTGANPNLPRGAVAELFAHHVHHVTGTVDALAAGNAQAAYGMLYEAAHQTQQIMDPLAGAIVRQFPQRFPGMPDSAASTLRTSLNLLGQEHVYLAGYAVSAALGGREAEFRIAAGAVDENSKALAAAVQSVYGQAAGDRFLALWRAHIGFFVDYTQGAAANDQAKKQKAVEDLNGYRRDIDAFLTGANPNLPRGAVAELFAHHVMHVAATADALAAGNAPEGFRLLREAAGQTQQIMDPLAGAIVRQFPQRFPTVVAGAAALPRTGAGPVPAANQWLGALALGGAGLLAAGGLVRRMRGAVRETQEAVREPGQGQER